MKTFIFITLLFVAVFADIPAHCLEKEIWGEWNLRLTPNTQLPDQVHCAVDPLTWALTDYHVTLSPQGQCVDEFGQTGKWTMIYDQAMEIRINDNSYFAFFDYIEDDSGVTTNCSKTLGGRSTYHEDMVLPREWGCIYGEKTDNHVVRHTPIHHEEGKRWSTTRLEHSRRTTIPLRKAPKSKEDKSFRNNYPTSFDWRDIDGQDYVGDIRDQLNCGSCFAFGTVRSMESRIRVASDNEYQVFLSPQDVVSCSSYSEACDGGFAIEVGRYMHDYGIIELRNFAYQWKSPEEVPCDWKHADSALTWYAEDYGYVGGYYGGCSEEAMMEAIYNEGPIGISISVSDDFVNWSGGDKIFYEAPEIDDDGFCHTDHIVAIVGWGEDAQGNPYWIVVNSWGLHFNHDLEGYINVARGNNDIGAESMAAWVRPIIKQ
eukprot:gnl/Dysnectes_brevis/602_a666_3810.p1 GENE.gnl/Dysnectes_brevis/602_a666_3810~~gnl/Dysnectes_brevis/602_a666_3810.p1  ORF type:complete len:429 (+),score=131.28 gnl/Dysnectes_brevis/602_a666_3810:55-1341(+)